MDRKEHLRFCKVCKKKSFDLEKGIVCSITGEHADFEDECPDFVRLETDSFKTEEEDDISLRELLRFFGSVIQLRFFITPLLIISCFILFFLSLRNSPMIIAPMPGELYRLGGLFKSITINGEFWRLLTYQFLHGDVQHLMTNLIGLFSIGFLLERIIGSMRILFVYVVCGIAAGVVSLLYDDLGVSVGASGSVYGLFGVYLVLLTTNVMDRKTRRIILFSLAGYLILSLLQSLRPGIDFAAHAGGLMTGFVLGLFIRPTYASEKKKAVHHVIFASGIICTIALSGFLTHYASNTENRYDAKVTKFSYYEQQALVMTEEYGDRRVDLFVSIVNRSIVPTWMKCKSILNTIDEIDGVTEDMSAWAENAMLYCDYQAKLCHLDACSRKLTTSDYAIMLMYCKEVRDELAMHLSDSSSIGIKSVDHSFSRLLQQLPDDRPLIIDGEPVLNTSALDTVNPLDIMTIHIIHKNTAKRMYGDFGDRGVVMMLTKRKIRDNIIKMPAGDAKENMMKLYAMQ